MTQYISPKQLRGIVSMLVGFFGQGRDSVDNYRFQELANVRSKDQGLDDPSVGDCFLDKETGVVYFAERRVYSKMEREAGNLVEKYHCSLLSLSVVTDYDKISAGVLEQGELAACLRRIQSTSELESANALVEQMKASSVQENHIFTDKMKRGTKTRIPQGMKGLAKLACI